MTTTLSLAELAALQYAPMPWADFKRDVLPAYEYPMCSKSHATMFRRVVKALELLNLAADGEPPRSIQTTADLTLATVTRYVASRPPGQSTWTLANHLRVIRVLCGVAVRMRALALNPFDIRPIKTIVRLTPPKDRRALSREELHKLLELLKADAETRKGWAGWRAHRLYVTAAIAAYTGMRRTEVLTLQVGDVDIEARVIRRRARIAELRAEGMTWTAIAEALGITKGHAWTIANRPPAGPRILPPPDGPIGAEGRRRITGITGDRVRRMLELGYDAPAIAELLALDLADVVDFIERITPRGRTDGASLARARSRREQARRRPPRARRPTVRRERSAGEWGPMADPPEIPAAAEVLAPTIAAAGAGTGAGPAAPAIATELVDDDGDWGPMQEAWASGGRCGSAALSDDEAREFRELRAEGLSVVELCEQFGVSRATGYRLARGQTYRDAMPREDDGHDLVELEPAAADVRRDDMLERWADDGDWSCGAAAERAADLAEAPRPPATGPADPPPADIEVMACVEWDGPTSPFARPSPPPTGAGRGAPAQSRPSADPERAGAQMRHHGL